MKTEVENEALCLSVKKHPVRLVTKIQNGVLEYILDQTLQNTQSLPTCWFPVSGFSS